MYVTFNHRSGKLVGQTLGVDTVQGCGSLKIDKELYEKLMDNPALYRMYRVELQPNGEHLLVETKELTWACRYVSPTKDEGPFDVTIHVSPKTVRAEYSVYLPEGVEVILMEDHDPAKVCFHGVLLNNTEVEANLRNIGNLIAYIPKVAKEYKYGVKLWQEEKSQS